MDYPKLRNVEIFPVQMEGRRMVCFRDPARITEGMVLFPYEFLFVISLFDGKHSITDIQTEYMRTFGDLLYSDHIVGVATELNRYYLLENEHYEAYRKKIENDFLQSPVRMPILAGNGYDAEADKLRKQLEGFFTQEEGPGQCPDPRSTAHCLKGLIAPHIDFMRGGPCYAWAYRELAEQSAEDVFILLGTSHLPTKKYFVLTRKDFITPFGPLSTDQTIMGRLEEELGRDFFADELVHRNEHSLEFQAVYLHYLFDSKRTITIVPILCGSYHNIITRHMNPRGVEEIALFLGNLKKILREDQRRICVVAGADLAHVGPQFGDPFRVSSAVMHELKVKDLAMLDHVADGDAQAFFEYIMRENDQRKICGLPPIYALLSLLEEGKGTLCKYSQWRDHEGNGAVTFASMVFH